MYSDLSLTYPKQKAYFYNFFLLELMHLDDRKYLWIKGNGTSHCSKCCYIELSLIEVS